MRPGGGRRHRRSRSARAGAGAVARKALDHRSDAARRSCCPSPPSISITAALQVRSAHPDRRPRERVPAPERRAQRGAYRRSTPKPSPARCSSCCRAISRARSSRRTSSPSARNSIRCCSGLSPLKSLLALFGIGRDPFSLTPEERVLDAYYDRLTAYAVDKSRVIVDRIPVARSGSRRARRQFDRRRLSGAAAGCAAGAGAGRPASGFPARSTICARRSPRPKRASRISAPSRACSSAPTTPRCRTSRWARSTRS